VTFLVPTLHQHRWRVIITGVPEIDVMGGKVMGRTLGCNYRLRREEFSSKSPGDIEQLTELGEDQNPPLRANQ